MKYVLFLFILGTTSAGFSTDRFHSDVQKTEEIFYEFNENLESICTEMKELNELQEKMLHLLQSITASMEDSQVETWSNP